MDKRKLIASATAALKTSSKSPYSVITKIVNGGDPTDSEYAVLLAVHRGFGLVLDNLDALENEEFKREKQ